MKNKIGKYRPHVTLGKSKDKETEEAYEKIKIFIHCFSLLITKLIIFPLKKGHL